MILLIMMTKLIKLFCLHIVTFSVWNSWKFQWWSSSKMTAMAVHGRAVSRNLSKRSRLLLKVAFHWRPPSIERCLPSKVVFHWRLSSIEGLLPSKVIFHRRSSFIKSHLQSMFFVLKMSSSILFSIKVWPKFNILSTFPIKKILWMPYHPVYLCIIAPCMYST